MVLFSTKISAGYTPLSPAWLHKYRGRLDYFRAAFLADEAHRQGAAERGGNANGNVMLPKA
jgi:hypothetical protein